MKYLKNKAATILIAIVLTISIVASTILIQPVSSHTPAWAIPTYAYINVAPNPVGVGQTVNILLFLDKTYGSDPGLINNYRFRNYNLTIIKPDGSLDGKIFDVVTDTTSSQGYSYTPDQVGNYTLIFTFPGQNYNTTVAGQYNPTSVYVNDTYLPSQTSTTMTVQQEPISNLPNSYPFPTEYWTRPIYGENPYWYTISSNWLGTGSPVSTFVGSGPLTGNAVTNFQRYPGDAVGPQTSHVMWIRPLQSGGVVGGNNSVIAGNTLFDGSAYVQRMSNPIIVNGKLYYTEPLNMPSSDSLGGGTYGPTVCVDLRSGQLLWSRTDVPALSFAYLYDIQDPQQHGTYPAILFTANFARAFDADTGAPLFNVTGVPSGTLIMGPQGEQLRIGMANAGTTANPDWRIVQWNSSKLWTGLGFATGTAGWVPTATGAIDASTSARYDWNVSIPWLNTMPSTPSVLVALYGDTMICMNGSRPALGSSNPYTYFAVSLKPQTLGNMTWIQTYNAPAGNVTVNQGPNDPVNRVFVEAYKETRQFVGYSMDSGAKLWGPTASQADLDYYGNGGTANIGAQAAYGKLYSIGYSGILYCYDSKTGDKLWTYGNGGAGNSTNAGFETGQGTYPAVIAAVGNGVIYLMSAEHTIQTPIYKGAMVRALNATDGTEIWTLSTYVNQFIVESFAIADGFATFPNSYDNMVYSIGRGPSATTVDAPMAAITQGSSLVIRGTVTDISAGTKQNQQAADHPNGVPVASDAIMTNWMGYIYQQKQLPTSFTGVEVTLSVIDSNGNQRTIGTTTTDSSGAYSYQWKPDITGKYEVTATFAGTNSYWPSSAVTSFAVDPAAPTPAPTQAPQQSTADTYLLSGIAAIIVVIVIIGAMIMLMLRKHP